MLLALSKNDAKLGKQCSRSFCLVLVSGREPVGLPRREAKSLEEDGKDLK